MTRINGISGVITAFLLFMFFIQDADDKLGQTLFNPWCYHSIYSQPFIPSNNKFKLVFNEKPPLLNITLAQVNLSNLWDCLARTNFEHN